MSVDISVKLRDFDRLDVMFRNDSNATPRYRAHVLNALANRLLTLIAQFAPMRTGSYIRSWGIFSSSADSVIVGSRADPKLFVMLEFSGARPHVIRPKNAKALRFVLPDGTTMFASVVNHPGMKSVPHLRPAMHQLATEAEGIAYAAMEAHFKLFKRKAAKAARARGYKGEIPPRQTARNVRDTTANIGRGNKGNISAQLTSRFTGRKRIRRRGLIRVGTGESRTGKQAGKIPTGGRGGEASNR